MKPTLAFLAVLLSAGPVYGQKLPTGSLGPKTLELPQGPASVKGLADPATVNIFSAQVGYGVPIEVPEQGSLSPALRLEYNGTLGNGSVGLGWTLSGPAIRRSTRLGVPSYDGNDELVLEGFGATGRLIEIAANEYRVEGQGNRVRVQRLGDRFLVTDADGRTLLFGDSAIYRQQNAGGRTFAWLGSRLEDLAGGVLTYRWRHDEGEVYLDRIEWGPSQRFRVSFLYQERPDAVVSYRAGFRTVTHDRLAEVRVTVGGVELRSYHLAYDSSRSFSRLTGVRATGKDGEGEQPPLAFTYEAPGETAVTRLGNTGGWYLDARGVTFVDVDGDGLEDLLRVEMGGSSWRRNLGGSFDEPRPLPGAEALELARIRLVDLDGDGRAEVVHQVADSWRRLALDEDGFRPLPEWRQTMGVPLAQQARSLQADVNGDGRADVVEAVTGGLRIRRGAGQGLGPAFTVGPISPADPGVEIGQPGVRLTDVNGDGLVDVLWQTDAWLKIFLGRGDGTFEAFARRSWPWGAGAVDPASVFFVDLDRDGLVDLVRLSAGRVIVYPGTGGHDFASTARSLARPEGVDPDVRISFADANGNGSVDVVWSSPRGLWSIDLAGPTSAGMLRSIDNGLGQTSTFTYGVSALLGLSAEQHGKRWQRFLPISVPVPVRVDSHLADGSPTRTMHYGVADGFWDGEERRFGGFLTSTRIMPAPDTAGTLVETTEYLAGEGVERALRGRAHHVRSETGTGVVLKDIRSEHALCLPAGLPEDPLLYLGVNTTIRTILGEDAVPVETMVTSTFDGECLPAEERHEGRLDLAGDERLVRRIHASDAGRWIRDRLVEERTLSLTGTPISVRRFLFADEAGVIGWPGLGKGWAGATDALLINGSGERWVRVDEKRYDGKGNVVEYVEEGVRHFVEWSPDGLYALSERVSPVPGRDLVWRMEWDPVLGRPVRLTDASGDATVAGYDPLGRVVSLAVNDRAPHQRYEYDFTAPRPRVTTFSFDGRLDQLAGAADAWRDHPLWRVSIEISNGLGEEIYSAVKLSATRWVVSGWQDRDGRGRTIARLDPFYIDGALPVVRPDHGAVQTLSYDAIDRVIGQQLASGARSSTRYTATCQTETVDGLAPVGSPGTELEFAL